MAGRSWPAAQCLAAAGSPETSEVALPVAMPGQPGPVSAPSSPPAFLQDKVFSRTQLRFQLPNSASGGGVHASTDHFLESLPQPRGGAGFQMSHLEWRFGPSAQACILKGGERGSV